MFLALADSLLVILQVLASNPYLWDRTTPDYNHLPLQLKLTPLRSLIACTTLLQSQQHFAPVLVHRTIRQLEHHSPTPGTRVSPDGLPTRVQGRCGLHGFGAQTTELIATGGKRFDPHCNQKHISKYDGYSQSLDQTPQQCRDCSQWRKQPCFKRKSRAATKNSTRNQTA